MRALEAAHNAATAALALLGDAPTHDEVENIAAFLDEASVAERYGLERRALVSARRRGELVGHQVGRRVLLEVAAVERWIRTKAASERPTTDPIDRALASGRVRKVGARAKR
jgi:hypothetical protein